jgi:hypothetical protein
MKWKRKAKILELAKPEFLKFKENCYIKLIKVANKS